MLAISVIPLFSHAVAHAAGGGSRGGRRCLSQCRGSVVSPVRHTLPYREPGEVAVRQLGVRQLGGAVSMQGGRCGRPGETVGTARRGRGSSAVCLRRLGMHGLNGSMATVWRRVPSAGY